MIAAYASLGRARSELVLLALAIGLALTTKFTGILALPVLALVAAVGNPIRRWPALAGVGLAGIVLGAPWYIVNRLETGHFDGALTSATAQVQERTLIAIAPTIRRELYSLVDFSGHAGSTSTRRRPLRSPRSKRSSGSSGFSRLSSAGPGESGRAGQGAAWLSALGPP